MPSMEQVMKGTKLVQARMTTPSHLPRLPTLLRKMKRMWQADSDKRDKKMLWAACTMCFFWSMRLCNSRIL